MSTNGAGIASTSPSTPSARSGSATVRTSARIENAPHPNSCIQHMLVTSLDQIHNLWNDPRHAGLPRELLQAFQKDLNHHPAKTG